MRKVLIIALGLASLAALADVAQAGNLPCFLAAEKVSQSDCKILPFGHLVCTHNTNAAQAIYNRCVADAAAAAARKAAAAAAAQARQKASNAALVAAARNSVRPQDGPAHSTPDQGGGPAPKYPAQGASTTMKSFTPAKPASGLHYNTP